MGWSEIYLATLELARKIDPKKYDLIVAILRGGACTASILSDLIGLDVSTIRVKSYRGTQRSGEPKVFRDSLGVVTGMNVLVVDDVCDTGESLRVVTEYLKLRGANTIDTFVLVKKSTCNFDVTYWYREINEWILFPWEVMEVMKQEGESVKVYLERLLGEEVARALLGEGQNSG